MKKRIDTIIHCFHAHVKDLGEVYFTFSDYMEFWYNHKPGMRYEMTNRNGSKVTVQVAYYPLPYYQDLRACIEFPIPGGIDFRDVPIKFLKRLA